VRDGARPGNTLTIRRNGSIAAHGNLETAEGWAAIAPPSMSIRKQPRAISKYRRR
jgi:hypothetical protein